MNKNLKLSEIAQRLLDVEDLAGLRAGRRDVMSRHHPFQIGARHKCSAIFRP